MGKNKVRFGLTNVHIAFIKEETEEGITFDKPIRLPGAVSLTTDPEGDEYKFYADNIAYYTTTNNDGYTGELEVALIPREIAIPMFGWFEDTNKVLVEQSNGKQKPFALLGQFEGDSEGGRVVYYNCKGSRPSDEYQTVEDGVEVQTQSIPITITPYKLDEDKFIVRGLLDKSDSLETYNGFFQSVYIPKPGTTKE